MMSFGIITIILDFLLLLLPVPIVWQLDLAFKQRIAVGGLFGLGFIVCIAGIVQACYVDKALIRSYDETWDGWALWVASAIEVDVGIVSLTTSEPFNAGPDDLLTLRCSFASHYPPFDRFWPFIGRSFWNRLDGPQFAT